MLILTRCIYAEYALKNLAEVIAHYNKYCSGKMVFIDAFTISTFNCVNDLAPDDWVFIFYDAELAPPTAPGFACKNIFYIDANKSIEELKTTLIDTAQSFVQQQEKANQQHSSHNATRRVNSRAMRMLHLFSQGYTASQTSEMMCVNSKTLYGWANVFVKQLKLRNLTQLRFIAKKHGTTAIADALLK